MAVLQTQELTKVYDGKIPCTALKNVSIEVDKGDFVAIMGPSGSGKSTFLNVISTIDAPTGGTVLINGKNPHRMNDEQLADFRRSKLGFVFQNFNLVNTLTVEENIMLPLTFAGVPVKKMKQRVKAVSEMLNITPFLKKRTYEISGGQAQRTAVARAVIMNPSLLLADEPTGNLDSKASKDVMELFTRLNVSMDAAILMVTHDSQVASYCKKVWIIKDGQLYQQINRGESQIQFYHRINEAMNLLGGNEYDVV